MAAWNERRSFCFNPSFWVGYQQEVNLYTNFYFHFEVAYILILHLIFLAKHFIHRPKYLKVNPPHFNGWKNHLKLFAKSLQCMTATPWNFSLLWTCFCYSNKILTPSEMVSTSKTVTYFAEYFKDIGNVV